MGRGPGEKRRFSGKSFVLSETYRQGSLADTLNYEQRNKEASFRAKVLRQSGFNARIVNGSGWTAIYVAVPDLQPMKKLPKPAKIAPTIPKAEIKPIPPSDDGKRFPDDLNISWTKELGLKTFKEPVKKKKPTQIETTRKKIIEEVEKKFYPVMEKAIKNGEGKMDSDGMGVFEPKVKFGEKSKVSNIRIVEGQEAKDLIETMTVKQGRESFSSWFKSAAKAGEVEWGRSKREEATKYARMFGGFSVNEEVPMFVIYVDEKPAFWSPVSGKLATIWKDQLTKANERIDELEKKGQLKPKKSAKKDEEPFKGWDRFKPMGNSGGNF